LSLCQLIVCPVLREESPRLPVLVWKICVRYEVVYSFSALLQK
jgi:hypothetical protein